MRAFRKPSKIEISPEDVKAIASNASNEFAFYTGTVKTNARKASGRTAVLTLVKEKRRPIPLATLAERARGVAGVNVGFEYSFVRSGLSLAQGAKPCVYFLLSRDDAGNYRAVKNIPAPDANFSSKPFKTGDIVVPAEKSETKALPAK
jgi:hypothetical protein